MPRKDSLFFRPGAKKKRGRPEEAIQKPIVKLLYQVEQVTKNLTFFTVPNQLLIKSTLRVIFHALGVRSGVPDLVILLKGGTCFFVELKVNPNKGAPPENQTSEDQDKFIGTLRCLGFRVYVLSARDAVEGQKMMLEILEKEGLTNHGVRL